MSAELAGIKIPNLSGRLEQGKLVNKLKKVFDDLRKIGDGKATVFENTDLSRFASELARQELVKHQDVSVQWLTAACSLQVFRVFYPEVPYSDPSMIKSVLDLYLRRMKAPPAPGSQQFWYYYNILEVAASIKVFGLCHNYSLDEIGKQIITTCINTVSVVHNKPKAVSSMVKIIEHYLSSAETISREMLDLVLMPLLQKSKSPAAYELCRDLWVTASADLEPFLQSLYSSSLGVGIGTEEERRPCLAIEHISDIILELHRIAPAVLNTVLPQMEYRLKVEDEAVRSETAQLLGRMFAEQTSVLAQENMSLWQSFCGRFQDVSAKVRSECVKVSQFLLVYHPEIRRAMGDKLELCLLDGIDEVRFLAVQSVLAAARENIDSVSETLLESAADRIRDKKFMVRQAAVKGLARLYSHFLGSQGQGVSEVLQRIQWIPSKILRCYYLQSIQDKLLVERAIHMQLLPSWTESEDGRQMTTDQQRVKTLMIVYSSLDDMAQRAFREILKTQTHVCGLFRDVLAKHHQKDEKQEERDQTMATLTAKLAGYLEEPLRAREHLSQLWSKLSDKRLMQCLKTASSRDSKCSEVTEAVFETLRKLGEKSPIRRTVDSLFHRACLRLVDSNAIHLLLNKLKQLLDEDNSSTDDRREEDETTSKETSGHGCDVSSAVLLVQALGEVCPWLFVTSDAIHTLLVLTSEEDELVVTTALQILTAVGKEKLTKTLRGLAGTVSNVVNKLALEGSPREAKCGLRAVVSTSSDVQRFFAQLYKKLCVHFDLDVDNLLTVLMTLRFVAETTPDLVLAQRKEVINDFTAKLLATDTGPGTRGTGWCEKSKLSEETKVKLSCMKVLVHFLEGLDTRDDPRTAKKFFEKTVDLLGTAIQRHGDLNDTGIPSSVDCAWMRYTAASSLMHLACGSSAYRQSLDPNPIFGAFTMMALDDCLEVRRRFLIKLNGLLVRKRLKPHYLAFFCFYAFEPNKELKSQAKSLLTKQVHSWREYARLQCQSIDNAVLLLPEYVVPTVVYLFAHHEDYGEESRSLYRIRDYLWFFLEAVTQRSDNLGFIKSLLEMIKCTHDATVHEDKEEQAEADRRLYIVSELAHMILSAKITNFRQFEFPGRAGLPPTLYRTKEEGGVVVKKILPISFNIYPKREVAAGDMSFSKAGGSSRPPSVSRSPSGGQKRRRMSTESPERGRAAKSSTEKQEKKAVPKRAASARAARSLVDSFNESASVDESEGEDNDTFVNGESNGTEALKTHQKGSKGVRSKATQNGLRTSPRKSKAAVVQSRKTEKQHEDTKDLSVSKRPIKVKSPKKLPARVTEKPLQSRSPRKEAVKRKIEKSNEKTAVTSTNQLVKAQTKAEQSDAGKKASRVTRQQRPTLKTTEKTTSRQSRSSEKSSPKRAVQMTREEAVDVFRMSNFDFGPAASESADDSLVDSPPKYQRKTGRIAVNQSLESNDSPIESPVKLRGKRKLTLDKSPSASPAKMKKVGESLTISSPSKPKEVLKVHRQRQLQWGGRISRSRRR